MNPITKEEMKPISDYKKVPMLVADGIVVSLYFYIKKLVVTKRFLESIRIKRNLIESSPAERVWCDNEHATNPLYDW